MKIGIVDYKLGNLGSVYSALKFYKYDVDLISDSKRLKHADVIILAGVGNFKTAVSRLKNTGFWDSINEEVIGRKKPILGICLGMQLFADTSSEDKTNRGFGWIKGDVVRIDSSISKVPHMGWNNIIPHKDGMFRGMTANAFYFMHSYHLIPSDKNTIAATVKYGGIELVSAVRKNNIVGVQFHPEKSQGDGLRFFRNFLESVV